MTARQAVLLTAALAVTALFALPAFASETADTFYLGTDGFPQGSLSLAVEGGQMPNFDPGRDIHPGLLLSRTERGLSEANDTGYQHWQVGMEGKRVQGYPTVVVWSAPADFDAALSGMYDVYLLDCPSFGQRCDELGRQRLTVPKGAGSDWVESTATFPAVDHEFGASRYLAVRIVVPAESESDMMFAFGFPKQRSRLTFTAAPPVATTLAVAPAPINPDLEGKRTWFSPPATAIVPTSADEARPESSGLAPWLATMAITTGLLALFSLTMLTKLGSGAKGEPAMVLAANFRQMGAPSIDAQAAAPASRAGS
ncbi:MAG: hypothetical protein WB245_08065 [Acidimicrobiia bacterium]